MIYIKQVLFYTVIINFQYYKTSEVKQSGAISSSLKVLNVYFCTICEITFLVGGP